MHRTAKLKLLTISIAALGGLSAIPIALGADVSDPPPYWAFPVPDHSEAPVADRGALLRVPGSKVRFTRAQTSDRFFAPDWRPKDHPPMPPIVARGKKPDVFACGYCHLPNGEGRPENAPLAGQPAAYIVEQVMQMRQGLRKTSVPQMGSIASMLKIAAHISPQDLKIAADYFSRLKYHPWIKVVETDSVPKTEISSHNMLVTKRKAATEPIGNRIIEVPINLELTERRDPASGFIAYVPKGSIARGAALVKSGGGAFPCASCHGPQLEGADNVPALRGRSPSYIVRQLYDFQHGTRSGAAADLMKPEVANLTPGSRLAIAAYLASLKP